MKFHLLALAVAYAGANEDGGLRSSRLLTTFRKAGKFLHESKSKHVSEKTSRFTVDDAVTARLGAFQDNFLQATSLLKEDKMMSSRLASGFMQQAHEAGVDVHTTEDDVKDFIDRVSESLQEVNITNLPTAEIAFEDRVDEIQYLANWTSESTQFQFCLNVTSDMPDLLSTSHTVETFDTFYEKCNEAEAFQAFPTYFNPIFASDLNLCYHLTNLLRLRLQIGLPPFMTTDYNHFCAFFIDEVIPTETEPPCMHFMERLQYMHIRDEELESILPYPDIIKTPNFNHSFVNLCSATRDDRSAFREIGFDEIECTERYANISSLAEETSSNITSITKVVFADRFCEIIGAPLPVPGNNTDHIAKAVKGTGIEGHRSMVAGVFSLAQGFRHGLVDAFGTPLLDDDDDDDEALYLPSFVTSDTDSESGGCGEKLSCYSSMDHHNTVGRVSRCTLNECYRNPNPLELQESSANLASACTGSSRTSSISGGYSLGPLEVGGGPVQGYGINPDKFMGEGNPTWDAGQGYTKWAEQEFYETCLGINAANAFPSDADDILGLSFGFESGRFQNFENIPGDTIVSTVEAQALIFGSSISEIQCCASPLKDCSKCGFASGMEFVFPPTWFDVGYVYEACYAYPISQRQDGKFKYQNCPTRAYKLEFLCKRGPYDQVEVYVGFFGDEVKVHSGVLECGNGNNWASTEIFLAPKNWGHIDYFKIFSWAPTSEQIVEIDYFKLKYDAEDDPYADYTYSSAKHNWRDARQFGRSGGGVFKVPKDYTGEGEKKRGIKVGFDDRGKFAYLYPGNIRSVDNPYPPEWYKSKKCEGWSFGQKSCEDKGCFYINGICNYRNARGGKCSHDSDCEGTEFSMGCISNICTLKRCHGRGPNNYDWEGHQDSFTITEKMHAECNYNNPNARCEFQNLKYLQGTDLNPFPCCIYSESHFGKTCSSDATCGSAGKCLNKRCNSRECMVTENCRANGDGAASCSNFKCIALCMAGQTGFTKVEKVEGVVETEIKPLKELEVGDYIIGLDENQVQTDECEVVAVTLIGNATVYGNYTSDHYILPHYDASTDIVPHGVEGEEEETEVFELLSSCPVSIDESGKKTTFSICGEILYSTQAMPWHVYLSIHSILYKLVKSTGVTDLSAFKDRDYAAFHLPGLCSTGVECAETGDCDDFESRMHDFINRELVPDAKEKVLRAFPLIGHSSKQGSISFLISNGMSAAASTAIE